MPSNIPSMRSLLDDTQYKTYVKRIPAPLHANVAGEPWQLWVETPDHKWLTKTYTSYADAWKVGVVRYRAGCDFTVTSRRVFYAPPGEWYKVKVKRLKPYTNPHTGAVTTHPVEDRWRQTFFWPETDLNWCGRCRRPVYWMPLFDSHHALRRLPAISPDDNYRCLICGIRWIATPSISEMVKMEAKPS